MGGKIKREDKKAFMRIYNGIPTPMIKYKQYGN
jgi:hypothetical protein